MATLTVEIKDTWLAELELVVDEHRKFPANGVAPLYRSVDELIAGVLGTVIKGTTHPKGWERQVLYALGMIPEDSLYLEYRREPGTVELLQ